MALKREEIGPWQLWFASAKAEGKTTAEAAKEANAILQHKRHERKYEHGGAAT